jgi:hypothetical protein
MIVWLPLPLTMVGQAMAAIARETSFHPLASDEDRAPASNLASKKTSVACNV